MNNSEKLLKMLSGLIETGVLTSQDIAKGLLTSVKFNKEKFASKLDLVTRDEFNVLKKIIEKQQKEIINLKKRNQKGKEILTNKPPILLFDNVIFPPCDLTMSCEIDKPRPTPDLLSPLLLSIL